MIGQLATCDIENYGDLLYPVVMLKMLEARGWQRGVTEYAFMDGAAPGNAGYVTSAVMELLGERSPVLSALIVGGGDILRTDTGRLASHYKSIFRSRRKLGRLQCFIDKILGKPPLIEQFRQRYLNYNAPGPCLIDGGQFPAVGSVFFCSCGVPFEFPPDKRESARVLFENAAYVSVRDHQSREKLLAIGVQREIQVVPDLILTLSDHFDFSQERNKGRRILESFGVDTAKKVVCFQSTPYAGEPMDTVVSELKRYRERSGAEIALLPLGYCHKDDRYLKRLNKASGGAFRYVGVSSIFEMLSVLAACDLFVGTSMHGNITALSFGIPHLFGPIRVDKAEGFLGMVDLPSEFKLASWAELNDKLDMIAALPADFFATRTAGAKHKIHAAFDIMYSSLADLDRNFGSSPD